MRIWTWKKIYSRGNGFDLATSKIRIEDKGSGPDVWINLGSDGGVRIVMDRAEAIEIATSILRQCNQTGLDKSSTREAANREAIQSGAQ